MRDNTYYGSCERCNTPLAPVRFREEEVDWSSGHPRKTGRTRKACSHLVCPKCLSNFCVDDSFDGPWAY